MGWLSDISWGLRTQGFEKHEDEIWVRAAMLPQRNDVESKPGITQRAALSRVVVTE